MKEIYKNPYSKDNPDAVKDWAKALNLPFKEATKEGVTKLVDAAMDWSICACGNLCDLMPRYTDGTPIDYTLGLLGVKFGSSVRGMHNTVEQIEDRYEYEYYRKRAIETHRSIELRATEILKEMNII